MDRTERMLNLVVCLMAARQPVTRERIIQEVPGYADAPSPAALERMFERDKDELRTLGIPIETVLDASGDVEGYLIPRERYAMAPLDLTPDERSALQIAATVWRDAVLGPAALQAVHKIQSLESGPSPVMDEVADAQLNASDAATLALLRAVRQRRRIRFDYRGPQQAEPHRRTLDPWGIVTHEGAWYVVGFDVDRNEARVFRISRITGTVQVLAQEQQYPMPEAEDLARRVRMEPAQDQVIVAKVHVRSGAGGALRRMAHDDRAFQDVVLDVRGTSEAWLAGEICAAGDAAWVESPSLLRDEVMQRLQAVHSLHGGT